MRCVHAFGHLFALIQPIVYFIQSVNCIYRIAWYTSNSLADA